MSRVQVVASVEVDRTPAEVFAYLADVARHGEWSPRPLRVEGAAPGAPAAEGTRFTSYGWVPGDADHRNEVEVTQAEAPTRLRLRSTDGPVVCHNDFTVTPHGRGSRVERVMEMPRPAGLVGFVFPVIVRLVIRPDLAKGLRMLKTRVETASAAA